MSWAALVKSTPAPEEGAGNETQQTQQKATAPAAGAPKTQAVVDSNAIMKGLRLESVADQLVTVQEVINEVRDKQSRAFLASLPFGIDVKEPTEDSLKAVTAFARATGDIHALSKTDLKLLALVHTLEVAAHGSAHIRTSPAQALVKPRHRSNAGKGLPGWGKVANPEDWKVVDEAPEVMGQQGGTSRIIAQVQALDLNSNGASNDFLQQQQQQPQQQGQQAQAGHQHAAQASPQAPLPFASFGEAAAAALGMPLVPPPPLQPAAAPAGAQEHPLLEQASVAGTGHGDDDEEEEEEEGEWAVVGKSRNSERRQKRKQAKRDARRQWEEQYLQQQQQVVAGKADGSSATIAKDESAGPAGSAETQAAAAAAGQQQGQQDAGEGEEGQQQHGESGGDEDESEEHSGSEQEEEEQEGEDSIAGGDDGTTAAGSERGESTTASATDCGDVRLNTTSSVVCVTGDFPMQNVLLQMGLRLVSGDGKQITRLSRWALRCVACFFVTKEAGRLFCPRCGNMTLDKVEVCVGPDGAEFYGVRKKHILRGTRYSLPKPKGGRNNKKNPILREDEFMQRMKPRRQKPGAAAAGADLDPFAPEYGVDTWHEAGAKAATNTQAALASEKGAAYLLASWKHNPNERKRNTGSNRRKK